MSQGRNFGIVFNTPAAGASFIALTLFFFIVFSANSILSSIHLKTLGIIITLSSIGFLFLIIMIAFFLCQ
ncbi:hypothetical protein DesLBE_4193 [Desulfitobacterium sp. LBE]|uniref:Uncharacterized protein n=5 Tax=root TaxID=1 RepID=A0A098B687_DESHA|nr:MULTISPECIES: hypothetical protein [Desulfitobacterium]ACL22428.1 hypothetical protein Dhaf_4423 [Desulfitobacterium hafniense DCB-2]EHL04184.1 hypothetical protein HMPREF0322_05104 [Desulfitobacterium hafniense DP7]KTE92248.1 hypothetical protein AT727_04770 [Desulfitobacterium hafniense]MEA5023975.1 hypothetical protein [Desulfitobacterium hafniense]TWH59789.1 hypothetical protein DesLBE_4193 [Desulfitobacterium sp. LBE]